MRMMSANPGGLRWRTIRQVSEMQVVGGVSGGDASRIRLKNLGYQVNEYVQSCSQDKKVQDYTRKGRARGREPKQSKTEQKSTTANGGGKHLNVRRKYSPRDTTYRLEIGSTCPVLGEEERLGSGPLFYVVSGGPVRQTNGVSLRVEDYHKCSPVIIPAGFCFPPASEPQKRDKSEVDSSEKTVEGFGRTR